MTGPRVLVIDDSPTILKVVQLVLSKAGYRVDTADNGETGLDMAKADPPDLILLDFVMPKMNGYQVCREIAAIDELKDIPVVLMSAKGDQVGERFVKVMGIVDYITKPFSPEAITAVVQHTVSKYATLRGDEASVGDDTRPLTPSRSDLPTSAEVRSVKDAEALKARALDSLRDLLVDAISPRLVDMLELARSSKDAEDDGDTFVQLDLEGIEDAARRVIEDELLEQLFREAQPLFREANMEAALQGDVRVIPIAEILQLLDAQSQSGTLIVGRDEEKIEIYFKDGNVELATSLNLSEEYLLGRYMVESGLLSREDLEAFLETRAPGSKLLGTQLAKLGYISEADLRLALQQQTRELVYEVLRWDGGSFQFLQSRDLPDIAADASLGLDVEGILMEGFRRVDEWHLIEREINDFDMVFLRNEDAVAHMGRGRLTREELTVLELVNGKNTVKELIRASKMGSFEVSKMLYRLLSIKLIRRRVMPVAV